VNRSFWVGAVLGGAAVSIACGTAAVWQTDRFLQTFLKASLAEGSAQLAAISEMVSYLHSSTKAINKAHLEASQ